MEYRDLQDEQKEPLVQQQNHNEDPQENNDDNDHLQQNNNTQTNLSQYEQLYSINKINITTYSDISISKNYLSFDDILLDIGMGLYQIKIYLIFGLIGITEGSQITVFTLMVPLLKNQWGVEDDLNSLGTSIVFLGFLAGSLISGQFSDRFGRQLPFQVSVTLTIIFTFLQCLVQNIFQLIVIRGFLGLSIGVQGPLGATMLTEITPRNVRGRYMSLIQLSISLGQLYGLFIGSLTLESTSEGDWRSLIFWTVFPGIFAIILIYYYLDESAMFLLQDKNKEEKALQILDKMNTVNGKKVFDEFDEDRVTRLQNWLKSHLQKQHQKQACLENLFETQELKFLTSIIWHNWFVGSFLYYGIIILLPLLLDHVALTYEELSVLGENMFLKLSFSASSEIVAAFIAAMLIEQKGLGRKNSMILFFSLTGISSLLTYMDDISRFEIWAMLSKFFLTMTMIFVYQFTAEVYPTNIRTTGIGTANGLGRIGGIIMPWICLSLVNIDLLSPFLLFFVIAIITAIVDMKIPYDTLGRDLDS